jgi:hypothetical protein
MSPRPLGVGGWGVRSHWWVVQKMDTRQRYGDFERKWEASDKTRACSTIDVYTQAVSKQKRAPHGQVVEQLLAV